MKVTTAPPLLQLSVFGDNVSPSDIVYTDTESDAFVIVDAAADALQVTISEIPAEYVFESFYDNPDGLADLFTATTFTVQDGVLTPGP